MHAVYIVSPEAKFPVFFSFFWRTHNNNNNKSQKKTNKTTRIYSDIKCRILREAFVPELRGWRGHLSVSPWIIVSIYKDGGRREKKSCAAMKIDRLEREMLIVRGILIDNVTKKKKWLKSIACCVRPNKSSLPNARYQPLDERECPAVRSDANSPAHHGTARTNRWWVSAMKFLLCVRTDRFFC